MDTETKILSLCTVVSGRLWQLKKTLKVNVKQLIVDSVILEILAYNDDSVLPYIQEEYRENIENGTIIVHVVNDDYKPIDGSDFACGYTKHIIHTLAKGDFVFNLDADNFINKQTIKQLKDLKIGHFLFTNPWAKKVEGAQGRIGMHKSLYEKIGGYRDKGRADDSDMLARLNRFGFSGVFEKSCRTPLSNIEKE